MSIQFKTVLKLQAFTDELVENWKTSNEDDRMQGFLKIHQLFLKTCPINFESITNGDSKLDTSEITGSQLFLLKENLIQVRDHKLPLEKSMAEKFDEHTNEIKELKEALQLLQSQPKNSAPNEKSKNLEMKLSRYQRERDRDKQDIAHLQDDLSAINHKIQDYELANLSTVALLKKYVEGCRE